MYVSQQTSNEEDEEMWRRAGA